MRLEGHETQLEMKMKNYLILEKKKVILQQNLHNSFFIQKAGSAVKFSMGVLLFTVYELYSNVVTLNSSRQTQNLSPPSMHAPRTSA